MTTHKRNRASLSLRQLHDAQLLAVAGGISFLGVEERMLNYSQTEREAANAVADGLRSSGG